MTDSTTRIRLSGVLTLGAVVAVIVLGLALYTRAFVPTATVVLRTDRTGLIMDVGSTVTLRGVSIGEVSDIRPGDADVEMDLALRPDALADVPANVLAEIVPTTVFGTKYVLLSEPEDPAPERLEPGAVIDNRAVTTEVNTVFDNLAGLLERIDVAKVNSTLGEVATALSGRGGDIAATAAEAGDYLGGLEPSLPVLQRDLTALADVATLYDEVTPDLLVALDNTAYLADLVVDEAGALDVLLADLTGLARSGSTVFDENGRRLATVLGTLRPTTGLLEEYSPALGCLVEGLDRSHELISPVVGGDSPGFRLSTSVLPGQTPYQIPEDLPETMVADPGPNCHGLPAITLDNLHSERVVTGGTDPYRRGEGNDLTVRPDGLGLIPPAGETEGGR